MKIDQILLKYDTDKNKGAVNDRMGHFYGLAYQRIFDNFDRLSSLKILEVGVHKGGSLLAWKEYFINSEVIGIDIFDSRINEYRKETVNFILSDINSNELKHNPLLCNKKFDIMIDDGSHFLKDVLSFLRNYMGLLNNGGYFVIEDVQYPVRWTIVVKSYILFKNILGIFNKNKYKVYVEDMRKINGYYDDYLIVIKKVN
jgi:SAM-dependent methyltransferase